MVPLGGCLIPEAYPREYLCAIKDVFSGRIVGYSISDRMRTSVAVRALENAVAPRSGRWLRGPQQPRQPDLIQSLVATLRRRSGAVAYGTK